LSVPVNEQPNPPVFPVMQWEKAAGARVVINPITANRSTPSVTFAFVIERVSFQSVLNPTQR